MCGQQKVTLPLTSEANNIATNIHKGNLKSVLVCAFCKKNGKGKY